MNFLKKRGKQHCNFNIDAEGRGDQTINCSSTISYTRSRRSRVRLRVRLDSIIKVK